MGNFDAVEIFVLRVAHLVVHVSVDGIGKPRVHQFHEILIVDRPVDLVFPAHHGEGNNRHSAAVLREAEIRGAYDGQRDGRGVGRRQRRFQESVRREHDLELAEIGNRYAVEIRPRLGHDFVALHVPGDGAVQKRDMRCSGMGTRPSVG